MLALAGRSGHDCGRRAIVGVEGDRLVEIGERLIDGFPGDRVAAADKATA